MKVNPKIWLLVLSAGLSWADDIDAEIIKDLDFYSNLDVVESQEMIKLEEPIRGEHEEK